MISKMNKIIEKDKQSPSILSSQKSVRLKMLREKKEARKKSVLRLGNMTEESNWLNLR